MALGFPSVTSGWGQTEGGVGYRNTQQCVVTSSSTIWQRVADERLDEWLDEWLDE